MGGDVTSYTKEDFQDHILSKTGQQFPAMLASAAVGLSNASLNEDTKDDDFRKDDHDLLNDFNWGPQIS